MFLSPKPAQPAWGTDGHWYFILSLDPLEQTQDELYCPNSSWFPFTMIYLIGSNYLLSYDLDIAFRGDVAMWIHIGDYFELVAQLLWVVTPLPSQLAWLPELELVTS